MKDPNWIARFVARIFGRELPRYTPTAGLTPQQIGSMFMVRPEDLTDIKDAVSTDLAESAWKFGPTAKEEKL